MTAKTCPMKSTSVISSGTIEAAESDPEKVYRTFMENHQLAKELIQRLNNLIQADAEVCKLVQDLIATRVPVSKAVADHPTIQVAVIQMETVSDTINEHYQVGLLGLLNGLVGPIEGSGPNHYITANYAHSKLTHFTYAELQKADEGAQQQSELSGGEQNPRQ